MICAQHGTDHSHTDGKDTCCDSCGEWWQGRRPCHCMRCHTTWANEGDFTRHQKRGNKCDPKGLVPYQGPGDPPRTGVGRT